jgi:hypothetical protein
MGKSLGLLGLIMIKLIGVSLSAYGLVATRIIM